MLIKNEAIHVSVSMAVAGGLKKHIANGVEFNMRVSPFSIVFKTKNQRWILTGDATANESTHWKTVRMFKWNTKKKSFLP